MAGFENLGTQPISGGAPQGSEPKYEAAYELMQNEIQKMSSVSGGTVDWGVVESSAVEVLSTLAKDIPAAGYLAVALGQTKGLEGWAMGTQIFADILENYWDTAFPPLKRLRARINTLDWWKERSIPLLEKWQSNVPYSPEIYSAAEKALAALDTQVGERMELPPLREVQELLRRLPQHEPSSDTQEIAETPAPPKPAEASKNATASMTSASLAASETPPGSVAEAHAVLHRLAGETLSFLCGPEPATDALTWKIVYASLLGRIVSLPPADCGMTAVPGPDAPSLDACRNLLESGNPVQAVASAVAFAPSCPLWLDVHRCVAEALSAAGAHFAAALGVVRLECAALVERLPQLSHMTFADGTPFADGKTQTWLKGLASSNGEAPESPETLLIKEAFAQAGSLMGNDYLYGALEVLEDARRKLHGRDPVGCLRLRIRQMSLLCRGHRFDLAAGLADEITSGMNCDALEIWQPALALEVWQAAHEAWGGMESEDAAGKTRQALLRVARLSPAAALRLENNL